MSTPYPQQPEQHSSGPYAPAQPSPQGYAAVPQGYSPGYAPVTQGPVVQKVNPDPSGKEVIGFLPLFALMFIGPVNLAGGVIGIVGAVGKPKMLKLNWLGILLNASPYVIFTVLPFLLPALFGR